MASEGQDVCNPEESGCTMMEDRMYIILWKLDIPGWRNRDRAALSEAKEKEKKEGTLRESLEEATFRVYISSKTNK